MKNIFPKRKKHIPPVETAVSKDGFPDFMKKEIFTQMKSIERFLKAYTDAGKINFTFYKIHIEKIKRAYIVCDYANYCCAVFGAYNFEIIADLICMPVLMSEFNCANPVLDRYTLVIVVGESDSRDKSSCVNRVLKSGAKLISIQNKCAGDKFKNCVDINYRQLGVVPTAVNTMNNIALSLMCLYFGKKGQVITDLYYEIASKMIFEIGGRVKQLLKKDCILNSLSKEIAQCKRIIFTGINTDFACAVYGEFMAEKLCGIHAKAVPAGELAFSQEAPELIIAFISNRELMPPALMALYPYRENTLLVVPQNLKNEMSGFENKVTYDGLLPLYNPIMGNVVLQILFYHIAGYKSIPTDKRGSE